MQTKRMQIPAGYARTVAIPQEFDGREVLVTFVDLSQEKTKKPDPKMFLGVLEGVNLTLDEIRSERLGV